MIQQTIISCAMVTQTAINNTKILLILHFRTKMIKINNKKLMKPSNKQTQREE
jgi:hypothetical protein